MNRTRLGPQLKLFLSELGAGKNPTISVLMGIEEAEGDSIQDWLGRLDGAELRTRAGDVMTASLPSSDLVRLCDQPGVRSVELSSPLHPENNE